MKKNTTSGNDSSVKTGTKSFPLVDFLVVIVFLCIALFCINLFRLDLMQTINLRNVEPVGTVVIRKNVVQRRLADRVLWDRLASESNVYLGDLIRVAELSAATLYIEGNSINLSENTLIRLTRAADGESLQIIMDEGVISISATEESRRVSVDINGRQVQVASAAVLNVTSADNGVVLQVSEGVAQFIDDGQTREINAGSLVALDTAGIERLEKSVVVIQPVSNVNYINNNTRPYTVNFSWTRINLNDDDLLRLEIAADRNFNRIIHTSENLNRQALVVLDNGLWYWRLSLEGVVFSDGRISVIDGAGARLQSPAVSSVFNFTEEPPVINFHWDEVNEASSYILEICSSPDFSAPQVHRQSQVPFVTNTVLGEGTWYWRVKPVFPVVYTGLSSFSQASYFSVEHITVEQIIVKNEIEELTQWFAAEIPPEIATQIATQIAPVAAAQPELPPVVLPPPPPPPLPAALNLQPARGHRFSMNDLQSQRSINFTWQAVRGANAYIVTIYQQTDGGRRQLHQTQILTRNSYSLQNLTFLDVGTFIWQVEALNRGQNGTINQRGIMAESAFVLDFQLPSAIQIEGTGVQDSN